MEITQVKIFPVQEDKLKAFVSVVFDHCFMINDIKVIQGKDGLFLSMPSRRKKSGEFKDVAHPLNNETRRMLEERVLQEYRLEVRDSTPRRPDRIASTDRRAEAPPRDRVPVGRPQDGRPPEGRPQDGQTPDQPAPSGESAEGRTQEGRTQEGRTQEGRTPDGRTPDDRTPDDRTPDDRTPDGRPPDGRPQESRSPKVPMAAPVAAAAASDKTLEEVRERHLSDSFWSVS